MRPNSLHFSQRQMVTAPQLGQLIFTALSPGATFLPHEMQVDILPSQIRGAGYLKVEQGPEFGKGEPPEGPGERDGYTWVYQRTLDRVLLEVHVTPRDKLA